MSAPTKIASPLREFLLPLLALTIAGEAIFGLPFHIPRFFRPTLLRTLELSHLELGTAMAAYGVVAALSYFPGGLITDRFSSRRLMILSLLLTALGGFYFATLPPVSHLIGLYAFWGFTTIFLFWAPLIKLTQQLGGDDAQGRAFGLLESGRGLLALILATVATQLLAISFTDADAPKSDGLQSIVLAYSIATLASATLIYLFCPADQISPKKPTPTPSTETDSGYFRVVQDAVSVLQMPSLWAQAGIVFTAYCLFRGVDNFGVFATEVYGMDEVQSSRLTSYTSVMRPIAALTVGFVADRIGVAKVVSLCFAIGALGYLTLSVVLPPHATAEFLTLNILVLGAAIYGLRGIYFALVRVTAIPLHQIGAAVGLISVIGFAPDIFVAPLLGWLLENFPGPRGHQYYFLGLAILSILALALSFSLKAKYQVAHSSANDAKD